MTEKEKAKELVEFFYIDSNLNLHIEQAKLFARKVCQEVLGDMGADRGFKFWVGVLKEVENYE